MKLSSSLAMIATVLIAFSGMARATIQVGTQMSTTAETAFDSTISNTDLLAGATAVFSEVPNLNSNETGINDGLASTYSQNSGVNDTYFNHDVSSGNDLDHSPVVTFTLNTTVNTHGYTLSSINSIYGWQDWQSLSDQDYTISYTTVTNSTFTVLTTVAYNPFNPALDNTQQTSHENATDVTLTQLGNITGVNAIRFSFTPYFGPTNVEQGGQMIREIDVFGVASPESAFAAKPRWLVSRKLPGSRRPPGGGARGKI
jgi:hypothetical protein